VCCWLRVRDRHNRSTVLRYGVTEPFERLIQTVREHWELPAGAAVAIELDGDALLPTQTPADLDLEEGDEGDETLLDLVL